MRMTLTETSIAAKTITGIEAAFKGYKRMSGLPLHEAPEYLITVLVAQELHKGVKNTGVYLETSVKETLTESGSSKPGTRALNERRDGRFDILVKNDDRSWCVIEIKNPHCWPKIISDMRRISAVLKHHTHDSVVRRGVIAFYAHWKRKKDDTIQECDRKIREKYDDKIDAEASEIFKTTENYKFTHKLARGELHQEGDYFWRAYCLFVKIKYFGT